MATRTFLAVLIIALFSMECGKQPTDGEPSSPAEMVTGETVSFNTPDGFNIFAAWFTSDGQTGCRPVVILIHPYDQNLGIWIPFVPDLTDEGYHVLAYDIRGHGGSTFQNNVYFPRSTFQTEDFNNMPLDVEGAIGWLKTRADVDAARIGLLGTELGANIAFVSSGIYPEVKTSVAISLITRLRQDILLGNNVADFQPRSVLFVASHGDGYAYTSSELLAQRTGDPVRVSGYQGTAIGPALLNNPAARAEILQWLREHL